MNPLLHFIYALLNCFFAGHSHFTEVRSIFSNIAVIHLLYIIHF